METARSLWAREDRSGSPLPPGKHQTQEQHANQRLPVLPPGPKPNPKGKGDWWKFFPPSEVGTKALGLLEACPEALPDWISWADMSTQVSSLAGLSTHVDCTQGQVDSLQPLCSPYEQAKAAQEGLVPHLPDRTAHLIRQSAHSPHRLPGPPDSDLLPSIQLIRMPVLSRRCR